jgi:hypothetical protein
MLLDEVESQCQMDALARAGWLEGSESRTLVSTTDPRLASGPKVNTFEVPLSSWTESNKLFCQCAFEDGNGPQGIRDLVQQVIFKPENFPLPLKVMEKQRPPRKLKIFPENGVTASEFFIT